MADQLPPDLDPGIRDAVELLIAEGLTTWDSGDGYSKKEAIEAGEALDFGHVFVPVDQGRTAHDVIAAARSIPWADYGYQEPTVELLERDPEEPVRGDEVEVVGVTWQPGRLRVQP